MRCHPNSLVDHVVRVENSILWKRYTEARLKLAQIEPERATPSRIIQRWSECQMEDPEIWDDVNETMLFHGASNASCNALALSGFDIEHAGSVGGTLTDAKW